jgi:hypothetical protein
MTKDVDNEDENTGEKFVSCLALMLGFGLGIWAGFVVIAPNPVCWVPSLALSALCIYGLIHIDF